LGRIAHRASSRRARAHVGKPHGDLGEHRVELTLLTIAQAHASQYRRFHADAQGNHLNRIGSDG
jgi:hypothetical protein